MDPTELGCCYEAAPAFPPKGMQMQYLVAALVFVYLGHPVEPVYAAEPLTVKQMAQVTAGAVYRFQFNRYIANARTITDGVSNVATATNSNTTVQLQGSGR